MIGPTISRPPEMIRTIMHSLLFATGNARKISEALETLTPFEITVQPIKLHFDEIQHTSPAEIAKAKARAAFTAAGSTQPVVVSDTSWSIPALGGFPGGYMKDVEAWWTAQNWLDIMAHQTDRRIFCHEHVAYFDGDQIKHFEQTYEGQFVYEPAGREDGQESFEQVVTLYGGETMAEQLARGEHASASETLEHWRQFGVWYSGQHEKI